MTPEEKAKRYDEAFERVKELLSRCRDNRDRRTMVYRVEDIESIFSELKKSEDEKIKEDLIEWISDFPDMIWSGHYKKDVIAWLENQGEHHIACNEEQLKVLNEVLNFAANHESPYWNDYIFGTLNSLIKQLKKLKV